ncbi:ABC transporter permease [Desulfosarcina sp.]|uniref:ABC transporter permease n=1 Tax=Desulfosarcina sp. TaxID=2027861 RepID=UPI0029AAE279|nr:ABC transporter permease [Desulfosarcina sp.]MDX2452686.1 ABC transporter permease [Desulfosarcina sp.]
MSLVPFLSKRLVGLVVMLVALSALVFFFSRSIPGDVAAMYIGGMAKPEQIERARQELGLDQPLTVQYAKYMKKLASGDLGVSLRTHRPVFQDLIEKLPMSMEVVLWAIALAMVLGIGLGGLAALRQGTWIDEGI